MPDEILTGKILHVDDDPEIRLLISGALQDFGHLVVTAGSIAEAMKLANDFTFDLCILDVRLPDGSGVDLCRKLREIHPNVPIAYYSAYVDPEAVEAALSKCGDVYLKKPLSVDELQETVTGLLRPRK